MSVNKKKLTARGKEIYNAGVRDALKELRKWDGVIPDGATRKMIADEIMKTVSCKFPPQKAFSSKITPKDWYLRVLDNSIEEPKGSIGKWDGEGVKSTSGVYEWFTSKARASARKKELKIK